MLVAPDKYQGTLGAHDVAVAIARGIERSGAGPVELLPVADGGEGTIHAVASAMGAEIVETATASDALGRPVEGAFALFDRGRTALIESAQASGLWRLAPHERDPLRASTRGTGELITAALDGGAQRIIVAVGGTATTDGGRGALEALGAQFSRGAADLRRLRQQLRGVELVVACDVRNPMCGPSGAAAVFGPQKGAGPETVKRLERRLREWAALARSTTRRDPVAEQMSGAGGGLAGGLWAFAGAALRSGAALVLDTVGFDARVKQARAVVTGEGRLDEQTLAGKAVFEVATRSRQAGVPCYVVAGLDALGPFGKRLLNVEAEAAAGPGGTASASAVERAAARLVPRGLPAAIPRLASAPPPRRSRGSSAPR